jgi:hypothetical protein
VSTGPLCTVGCRPPGTYRVADCWSVKKLGFQLLGEMELSCRQVWWELLSFSALWESRPPGATYQVAGYCFTSLSMEFGIPTLWWERVWALQLGTVWSAGPLCTVGVRPPAAHSVVEYHSVEELEFHLLESGNGTLWHAGTMRSAGPLCTLGKQTS